MQIQRWLAPLWCFAEENLVFNQDALWTIFFSWTQIGLRGKSWMRNSNKSCRSHRHIIKCICRGADHRQTSFAGFSVWLESSLSRGRDFFLFFFSFFCPVYPYWCNLFHAWPITQFDSRPFFFLFLSLSSCLPWFVYRKCWTSAARGEFWVTNARLQASLCKQTKAKLHELQMIYPHISSVLWKENLVSSSHDFWAGSNHTWQAFCCLSSKISFVPTILPPTQCLLNKRMDVWISITQNSLNITDVSQ